MIFAFLKSNMGVKGIILATLIKSGVMLAGVAIFEPVRWHINLRIKDKAFWRELNGASQPNLVCCQLCEDHCVILLS